LKEQVGKLIGDAKLASDGAAERAVGDAQSKSGNRLVAGIDADRIAGVGRRIKGAGERALGRIIGDAKLAADGDADIAAGQAQNAAGGARDEAREAEKARQPAAEHAAPPRAP
jgi:uncharacterized protein YjbJ (UPF0337 family)